MESERNLLYDERGVARPKGRYAEIMTDGENPQHNGVLAAFAGAILRGTPGGGRQRRNSWTDAV